MKDAIVFVNCKQVSIVSGIEDLVKEINNYKCFYLSSIGNEYSNSQLEKIPVKIKLIGDWNEKDRKIIAQCMK